ncbi:lipid-binding SYLF domain-containing protein [Desulfoferrobacter suflitae]|uniref:lipid-binding SYLF domain-containing protein n=1 Tax=Desulfoferrobacter suflitae TaxID=2865782 RepID=UPI00216444E2|nr:lipid-binding SYLF domain-containing protein [Desulfoferrobacter suflitae]MCK8601068.1 lipid-binding SYLF domain-containing protein [Desulfoferrobacter suflitae]
MERFYTRSRSLAGALLTVLVLLSWGAQVLADDATESIQLVQKAAMTFQNFENAEEMGAFRDLMKTAKGVFIAPQVLKGAFIIGASGGSGVMLARDDKSNEWYGPAFYTIGGASFGLQAGGTASEVVLLAMTGRGVTAFLSNSLKLGADVGLAVGPVGAGAAAATANLSADIISFSRSKGLFGGVSLDGAVVATRDGLNEAYYGKKVNATDILVQRNVNNRQADGLKQWVRQAAAGE